MKAALDTATGLTQADAPLVELAKTLATQIDSSGPRETGSIIMTILADTSVGAGLADASAHRTEGQEQAARTTGYPAMPA